MKRFGKVLVAVILCLSMVLGILPVQLIGEDVAKAAEMLNAPAVAEVSGFQELLEQLEGGERRSAGEWQYVLFAKGRYAIITGHLDPSVTETEVPDQLGGADVVGIADGSFAGHDALSSVTIPGNVFAMGKNAIPSGVAVCAVNASYAQTWARKNGHAFRNTSRFELRPGVVDLSGTRAENFIRVSAQEMKLRELEAKRLMTGTRFFLLDPSNLYQISYYQAESISEPEGGFVTIRCSTPSAEDVVTHISAENEVMMPDYSTLQLEEGVSLNQTKRGWGSSSVSLPFKLSFDKKLGDDWKIYVEGELGTKFEATYDINVFGAKALTVKGTNTVSLTGGIEYKQEYNSSRYGDMTEADAEQILLQYMQQGKRKASNPLQVNYKAFSVAVFTVGGILNVMLDTYWSMEFSAKAEFQLSSTSTVTYKYQNNSFTKELGERKADLSFSAEGEVKAGITEAMGIYLTCLNVGDAETFIGINVKSSYEPTENRVTDAQGNSHVNLNMLDCIELKADFVIDVGIKVKLGGDILSFEPKANLITIPLGALHCHVNPWEYDYGTGSWNKDTRKDRIHVPDDCPYDNRTVSFVVPMDDGTEKTVATVDNVVIGSTIELPESALQTEELGKKVLGWYTEKECGEDTEIAFPATYASESDNMTPSHTLVKQSTLFAKATNYRETHLINSAGAELKDFYISIHRGDRNERWRTGTADIAGGEQFILPTNYKRDDGSQATIRQWVQVNNARERTIEGEPLDPGTIYTVDGSVSTPLYLMRLTDEDVVGHFIKNARESIDRYCAEGGTLSCPVLPDTLSSEFAGWTVTDTNDPNGTVIATLGKNEDFPTAGYVTADGKPIQDFTFVSVWQEKANPSFAGYAFPGIGDGSNYLGGGGSTAAFDLTFDGSKVTGIRSGVKISHLSIPEQTSNGTKITAIATEAFKNNSDLVSVYIPQGITSIGEGAFRECPNLETILMDASGVTYIPRNFAIGCPKLKTVSFPNGLSDFGEYAFYACIAAESLRVNCPINNNGVFMGCTSLNSVSLGGECNKLGHNTFNSCTGLEELTIPECVATIGNKVISGCVNLKTLNIGARTTLTADMLGIGDGSLLEEVNLLDGVKGLGNEALANGTYGFTHLETLTLPATLKSIGQRVFAGSAIKELSLYLPSGSVSAAYYAFSGMASLETVNIMGGNVPANAFSGNTNLTTLNVLGGSIGEYAFSGCTGLETVNLEEGVRSIGKYAFSGCTSLTSFTIPDSATYVGSCVLGGCVNVTYLKVGGGVPELKVSKSDNYSAFFIGNGSKLQTLVLGEGITTIRGNVFANYLKNASTDVQYGFGQLGRVEFPSTLTNLEQDAFKGSAITELVLADGLARGSKVFAGMTTLKKVTIKGGNIGEEAFSGCTGLEEVILEEGVKQIGRYAFSSCTSLTSFTIPDSVTHVGSCILSGCLNLTYLKVGGGMPEIKVNKSDNYSPFFIGNGSKLKTLILGEGITSIASNVFSNYLKNNTVDYQFGFSQMSEVRLPSTLTSLGQDVFKGSAITELVLTEGLASYNSGFAGMTTLKKVTIKGGTIGNSTFKGCTGLEEVILEEGVTRICREAFSGCTSLTSFTIPDSVTFVESCILSGCTNLTYLKVGGGMPKIYVNKSDNYSPFFIGEGSKLKTLILGEGITSISSNVFSNYLKNNTVDYQFGFGQLSEVRLPTTLVSLGQDVFKGSAITELVLTEGLASYGNGFTGMTTLKKVTIKGGTIGEYTFSGCTGLEEVVLEEGVTSIGARAFSGCTSLTRMTIPDSVTYLGTSILQGCTNLTYLQVGGGKPELYTDNAYSPFYIGDGAKLETLVLGEGITSIGNYVFSNYFKNNAGQSQYFFTQLTRVELPSTLTSLGQDTFKGAGITELVLANGLASGSGAFAGLTTLKKVTVKGGGVAYNAFNGCTGLEEAILEEGVTSIGDYAFAGCTSLTSFTIPDSVTTLGKNILGGCVNLTYLKIGGGIASLQINTSSYSPFYFGETTHLKMLVLGEGITEIGDYALGNCYRRGTSTYQYHFPELEKVVLPTTLRKIGSYNLSSWKMVTDLMLPDGLQSIEDNGLSASSGIVLYSTTFNSVISSFANRKGLTYIYDQATLPVYTLTKVVPAAGSVGGEAAGEIHVTRGLNGEETTLAEGYTILSTEEIALGDAVNPGEPDVAENYAFYGWFADPEYRIPWTLSVMPAANITLYAKIRPLVSVRYIINRAGADESLPDGFSLWAEYRVREYEAIPTPSDPSGEGYTFTGWYMDAGFTRKYVPKAVTTEDVLIYGKLEKLSVGATWRTVDGGCYLTGYRRMENDPDSLYLPAAVNGMPVTGIDAYAFRESGIKTLYIPDTVTFIDPNAFAGSEIYSFTVSKGNPAFAAVNGILYNKDKTVLLYWPAGRKSQTFSVPATVTAIGENAFADNGHLTGVTFAEGLTEIRTGAFRGCTKLESVTLPNSVTTLGDYAFADCTAMTAFTAYGLTTIGEKAIPTGIGVNVRGPLGDNPLRRLFVTENGDGQEINRGYNLYLVKLYINGSLADRVGCEAGYPLQAELWGATFADGTQITAWYKDSKFSQIWNPNTDVMPAADLSLYGSKTAIYDYETATVTIDETEYSGIRLTAYHGTAGSLIIPDTYAGQAVIALGEGFLAAYSGTMAEITIPSSIISIGNTALTNSNGAAFSGTVICDAGSYAETWAGEKGYVTANLLYRLTLHEGDGKSTVFSIAKGTVQRLAAPGRIGATFLGWFEDEACSTEATLTDNCYTMPGQDTNLYAGWEIGEEVSALPFTWTERNGEIIITGYTGEEDSVTIPERIGGLPVTAIGEEAFSGLDIRSINLGQVTTIGNEAFAGCGQLVQITLPDSVTEVATKAFDHCTALQSITIGTGLVSFSAGMVNGCEKMKSVTVSEGNEALSSLNGVVFSKDGTELLYYPWAKAAASYTIPDSVSIIGDGAFQNAHYAEHIIFPEAVSWIGSNAFAGCDRLQEVDAAGLTYIGENAFFGCSGLESVNPGTGLLSIGKMAFVGCNRLADIQIPQTAELDIRYQLFSNPDELIIHGVWGSSAQIYADAYGIAFHDPDVVCVTGIRVNGMPEILRRGQAVQLTVSTEPADAVIGTEYKWSTTDRNVAFVDSENCVRPVGQGTAVLTVRTGNGVQAAFRVEVGLPVPMTEAVITVSNDQLFTVTGCGTGQADIQIEPEDTTDRKILWVSSNPAVLTVDENGRMRAVSAGTAVITACGGREFGENWRRSTSITVITPEHVMNLPSALTTVMEEAFESDNGVDCVIMSDQVTGIGASAFANMTRLKLAVIPGMMTEIAPSAFAGSTPVIAAPQGSAGYNYAVAHELEWLEIAEED